MISIRCAGSGGEHPRERAGARLVRVMLALSAFGVASDAALVTGLGGEGAASLAGSLVLGAPIVAAGAWRLLTYGRLRAIPPEFIALLAFAGWSGASVLWSMNEHETVKRAITNAQLVTFLWLGWQTIRSERELRAILSGFVVGCVLLVALTWKNYLAGDYYSWGRFSADGFDPNDMSVYLAIGIPMASYLALASPLRRDLLWLICLPMAFSGLALSGSRAGLLSMGVAVASLLIWVSRRNATALGGVLALIGAGLTLGAGLAPAENWSRLISVRDEVTGTMGARTDIWHAGFALLEQHPIAGVGAGAFPDAVIPAIHMRIVAHSTPLSISVELGLIGLVLFLAAIALLLWGVRWSGLDQRTLAWSLVLTVGVGTASLSWEAYKPMWLIFLLGAVLGAERSGREPAEHA